MELFHIINRLFLWKCIPENMLKLYLLLEMGDDFVKKIITMILVLVFVLVTGLPGSVFCCYG